MPFIVDEATSWACPTVGTLGGKNRDGVAVGLQIVCTSPVAVDAGLKMNWGGGNASAFATFDGKFGNGV
jgi:hypothetical protein